MAKSIKSSCDDTKHYMHLPRRHMVFLYSAAFQCDHILCKGQYAKNSLAIVTLSFREADGKENAAKNRDFKIGYLKVFPSEL